MLYEPVQFYTHYIPGNSLDFFFQYKGQNNQYSIKVHYSRCTGFFCVDTREKDAWWNRILRSKSDRGVYRINVAILAIFPFLANKEFIHFCNSYVHLKTSR